MNTSDPIRSRRSARCVPCLPVLLLPPLLAAGNVAHAQPALEEIVVTAQKREENLYEVPVAVSAFDDEKLKQAILDDVADLGRFAPSLTANNVSAGGSTYTSSDGRWTVAAWGKNLGDEVYVLQIYPSGLLGMRGLLAPPRTYGLRIGYSM